MLISILLFFLLRLVNAFLYAIHVTCSISKIRFEIFLFMSGSISVQNIEGLSFSECQKV